MYLKLAYNDDDLDGSIQRCFTLEDVERTEKIKGETAIPKGIYNVALTWSPKFRREVMMLENVPNFERIYIHGGNDHNDTEGCILVGNIRRGTERIDRSNAALSDVMQLFNEAKARGESVKIEII
jgi:hypothetical protein